MNRIVVIGGGAAGMMAAIAAADSGADVTLLEKNEKLGKKIYITGKGRCNLTNACDTGDFFENVSTNDKFLYSSVYSFDSAALRDFFENAGLRLKVERGNRVFPVSDKSSDVIKTLEKECRRAGVRIILNTKVADISCREADDRDRPDKDHPERGALSEKSIYDPENKQHFLIICEAVSKEKLLRASQTIYEADSVIIATGGLSYPSTGSTGDGYRFAESFGHRIKETHPSLVPIVLEEKYVKELEGLSLRNICVKIAKDASSKPVYEGFGEMVFTADGVSGPLILTATSVAGHCFDKQYRLYIDLKPALDEKQLDSRILRDFNEGKNKSFKNSLGKLLPAKLIPVIVKLSCIDPDTKVNEVTKAQRTGLVKLLKGMEFTVKGLGGFETSVITRGGVDVRDVDPGTMESKLVKGLYFAGEVLDVDAQTGGFNLQIAFSTGHAAGMAAAFNT